MSIKHLGSRNIAIIISSILLLLIAIAIAIIFAVIFSKIKNKTLQSSRQRRQKLSAMGIAEKLKAMTEKETVSVLKDFIKSDAEGVPEIVRFCATDPKILGRLNKNEHDTLLKKIYTQVDGRVDIQGLLKKKINIDNVADVALDNYGTSDEFLTATLALINAGSDIKASSIAEKIIYAIAPGDWYTADIKFDEIMTPKLLQVLFSTDKENQSVFAEVLKQIVARAPDEDSVEQYSQEAYNFLQRIIVHSAVNNHLKVKDIHLIVQYIVHTTNDPMRISELINDLADGLQKARSANDNSFFGVDPEQHKYVQSMLVHLFCGVYNELEKKLTEVLDIIKEHGNQNGEYNTRHHALQMSFLRIIPFTNLSFLLPSQPADDHSVVDKNILQLFMILCIHNADIDGNTCTSSFLDPGSVDGLNKERPIDTASINGILIKLSCYSQLIKLIDALLMHKLIDINELASISAAAPTQRSLIYLEEVTSTLFSEDISALLIKILTHDSCSEVSKKYIMKECTDHIKSERFEDNISNICIFVNQLILLGKDGNDWVNEGLFNIFPILMEHSLTPCLKKDCYETVCNLALYLATIANDKCIKILHAGQADLHAQLDGVRVDNGSRTVEDDDVRKNIKQQINNSTMIILACEAKRYVGATPDAQNSQTKDSDNAFALALHLMNVVFVEKKLSFEDLVAIMHIARNNQDKDNLLGMIFHDQDNRLGSTLHDQALVVDGYDDRCDGMMRMALFCIENMIFLSDPTHLAGLIGINSAGQEGRDALNKAQELIQQDGGVFFGDDEKSCAQWARAGANEVACLIHIAKTLRLASIETVSFPNDPRWIDSLEDGMSTTNDDVMTYEQWNDLCKYLSERNKPHLLVPILLYLYKMNAVAQNNQDGDSIDIGNYLAVISLMVDSKAEEDHLFFELTDSWQHFSDQIKENFNEFLKFMCDCVNKSQDQGRRDRLYKSNIFRMLLECAADSNVAVNFSNQNLVRFLLCGAEERKEHEERALAESEYLYELRGRVALRYLEASFVKNSYESSIGTDDEGTPVSVVNMSHEKEVEIDCEKRIDSIIQMNLDHPESNLISALTNLLHQKEGALSAEMKKRAVSIETLLRSNIEKQEGDENVPEVGDDPAEEEQLSVAEKVSKLNQSITLLTVDQQKYYKLLSTMFDHIVNNLMIHYENCKEYLCAIIPCPEDEGADRDEKVGSQRKHEIFLYMYKKLGIFLMQRSMVPYRNPDQSTLSYNEIRIKILGDILELLNSRKQTKVIQGVSCMVFGYFVSTIGSIESEQVDEYIKYINRALVVFSQYDDGFDQLNIATFVLDSYIICCNKGANNANALIHDISMVGIEISFVSDCIVYLKKLDRKNKVNELYESILDIVRTSATASDSKNIPVIYLSIMSGLRYPDVNNMQNLEGADDITEAADNCSDLSSKMFLAMVDKGYDIYSLITRIINDINADTFIVDKAERLKNFALCVFNTGNREAILAVGTLLVFSDDVIDTSQYLEEDQTREMTSYFARAFFKTYGTMPMVEDQHTDRFNQLIGKLKCNKDKLMTVFNIAKYAVVDCGLERNNLYKKESFYSTSLINLLFGNENKNENELASYDLTFLLCFIEPLMNDEHHDMHRLMGCDENGVNQLMCNYALALQGGNLSWFRLLENELLVTEPVPEFIKQVLGIENDYKFPTVVNGKVKGIDLLCAVIPDDLTVVPEYVKRLMNNLAKVICSTNNFAVSFCHGHHFSQSSYSKLFQKKILLDDNNRLTDFACSVFHSVDRSKENPLNICVTVDGEIKPLISVILEVSHDVDPKLLDYLLKDNNNVPYVSSDSKSPNCMPMIRDGIECTEEIRLAKLTILKHQIIKKLNKDPLSDISVDNFGAICDKAITYMNEEETEKFIEDVLREFFESFAHEATEDHDKECERFLKAVPLLNIFFKKYSASTRTIDFSKCAGFSNCMARYIPMCSAHNATEVVSLLNSLTTITGNKVAQDIKIKDPNSSSVTCLDKVWLSYAVELINSPSAEGQQKFVMLRALLEFQDYRNGLNVDRMSFLFQLLNDNGKYKGIGGLESYIANIASKKEETNDAKDRQDRERNDRNIHRFFLHNSAVSEEDKLYVHEVLQDIILELSNAKKANDAVVQDIGKMISAWIEEIELLSLESVHSLAMGLFYVSNHMDDEFIQKLLLLIYRDIELSIDNKKVDGLQSIFNMVLMLAIESKISSGQELIETLDNICSKKVTELTDNMKQNVLTIFCTFIDGLKNHDNPKIDCMIMLSPISKLINYLELVGGGHIFNDATIGEKPIQKMIRYKSITYFVFIAEILTFYKKKGASSTLPSEKEIKDLIALLKKNNQKINCAGLVNINQGLSPCITEKGFDVIIRNILTHEGGLEVAIDLMKNAFSTEGKEYGGIFMDISAENGTYTSLIQIVHEIQDPVLSELFLQKMNEEIAKGYCLYPMNESIREDKIQCLLSLMYTEPKMVLPLVRKMCIIQNSRVSNSDTPPVLKEFVYITHNCHGDELSFLRILQCSILGEADDAQREEVMNVLCEMVNTYDLPIAGNIIDIDILRILDFCLIQKDMPLHKIDKGLSKVCKIHNCSIWGIKAVGGQSIFSTVLKQMRKNVTLIQSNKETPGFRVSISNLMYMLCNFDMTKYPDHNDEAYLANKKDYDVALGLLIDLAHISLHDGYGSIISLNEKFDIGNGRSISLLEIPNVAASFMGMKPLHVRKTPALKEGAQKTPALKEGAQKTLALKEGTQRTPELMVKARTNFLSNVDVLLLTHSQNVALEKYDDYLEYLFICYEQASNIQDHERLDVLKKSFASFLQAIVDNNLPLYAEFRYKFYNMFILCINSGDKDCFNNFSTIIKRVVPNEQSCFSYLSNNKLDNELGAEDTTVASFIRLLLIRQYNEVSNIDSVMISNFVGRLVRSKVELEDQRMLDILFSLVTLQSYLLDLELKNDPTYMHGKCTVKYCMNEVMDQFIGFFDGCNESSFGRQNDKTIDINHSVPWDLIFRVRVGSPQRNMFASFFEGAIGSIFSNHAVSNAEIAQNQDYWNGLLAHPHRGKVVYSSAVISFLRRETLQSGDVDEKLNNILEAVVTALNHEHIKGHVQDVLAMDTEVFRLLIEAGLFNIINDNSIDTVEDKFKRFVYVLEKLHLDQHINVLLGAENNKCSVMSIINKHLHINNDEMIPLEFAELFVDKFKPDTHLANDFVIESTEKAPQKEGAYGVIDKKASCEDIVFTNKPVSAISNIILDVGKRATVAVDINVNVEVGQELVMEAEVEVGAEVDVQQEETRQVQVGNTTVAGFIRKTVYRIAFGDDSKFGESNDLIFVKDNKFLDHVVKRLEHFVENNQIIIDDAAIKYIVELARNKEYVPINSIEQLTVLFPGLKLVEYKAENSGGRSTYHISYDKEKAEFASKMSTGGRDFWGAVKIPDDLVIRNIYQGYRSGFSNISSIAKEIWGDGNPNLKKILEKYRGLFDTKFKGNTLDDSTVFYVIQFLCVIYTKSNNIQSSDERLFLSEQLSMFDNLLGTISRTLDSGVIFYSQRMDEYSNHCVSQMNSTQEVFDFNAILEPLAEMSDQALNPDSDRSADDFTSKLYSFARALSRSNDETTINHAVEHIKQWVSTSCNLDLFVSAEYFIGMTSYMREKFRLASRDGKVLTGEDKSTTISNKGYASHPLLHSLLRGDCDLASIYGHIGLWPDYTEGRGADFESYGNEILHISRRCITLCADIINFSGNDIHTLGHQVIELSNYIVKLKDLMKVIEEAIKPSPENMKVKFLISKSAEYLAQSKLFTYNEIIGQHLSRTPATNLEGNGTIKERLKATFASKDKEVIRFSENGKQMIAVDLQKSLSVALATVRFNAISYEVCKDEQNHHLVDVTWPMDAKGFAGNPTVGMYASNDTVWHNKRALYNELYARAPFMIQELAISYFCDFLYTEQHGQDDGSRQSLSKAMENGESVIFFEESEANKVQAVFAKFNKDFAAQGAAIFYDMMIERIVTNVQKCVQNAIESAGGKIVLADGSSYTGSKDFFKIRYGSEEIVKALKYDPCNLYYFLECYCNPDFAINNKKRMVTTGRAVDARFARPEFDPLVLVKELDAYFLNMRLSYRRYSTYKVTQIAYESVVPKEYLDAWKQCKLLSQQILGAHDCAGDVFSKSLEVKRLEVSLGVFNQKFKQNTKSSMDLRGILNELVAIVKEECCSAMIVRKIINAVHSADNFYDIIELKNLLSQMKNNGRLKIFLDIISAGDNPGVGASNRDCNMKGNLLFLIKNNAIKDGVLQLAECNDDVFSLWQMMYNNEFGRKGYVDIASFIQSFKFLKGMLGSIAQIMSSQPDKYKEIETSLINMVSNNGIGVLSSLYSLVTLAGTNLCHQMDVIDSVPIEYNAVTLGCLNALSSGIIAVHDYMALNEEDLVISNDRKHGKSVNAILGMRSDETTISTQNLLSIKFDVNCSKVEKNYNRAMLAALTRCIGCQIPIGHCIEFFNMLYVPGAKIVFHNEIAVDSNFAQKQKDLSDRIQEQEQLLSPRYRFELGRMVVCASMNDLDSFDLTKGLSPNIVLYFASLNDTVKDSLITYVNEHSISIRSLEDIIKELAIHTSIFVETNGSCVLEKAHLQQSLLSVDSIRFLQAQKQKGFAALYSTNDNKQDIAELKARIGELCEQRKSVIAEIKAIADELELASKRQGAGPVDQTKVQAKELKEESLRSLQEDISKLQNQFSETIAVMNQKYFLRYEVNCIKEKEAKELRGVDINPSADRVEVFSTFDKMMGTLDDNTDLEFRSDVLKSLHARLSTKLLGQCKEHLQKRINTIRTFQNNWKKLIASLSKHLVYQMTELRKLINSSQSKKCAVGLAKLLEEFCKHYSEITALPYLKLNTEDNRGGPLENISQLFTSITNYCSTYKSCPFSYEGNIDSGEYEKWYQTVSKTINDFRYLLLTTLKTVWYDPLIADVDVLNKVKKDMDCLLWDKVCSVKPCQAHSDCYHESAVQDPLKLLCMIDSESINIDNGWVANLGDSLTAYDAVLDREARLLEAEQKMLNALPLDPAKQTEAVDFFLQVGKKDDAVKSTYERLYQEIQWNVFGRNIDDLDGKTSYHRTLISSIQNSMLLGDYDKLSENTGKPTAIIRPVLDTKFLFVILKQMNEYMGKLSSEDWQLYYYTRYFNNPEPGSFKKVTSCLEGNYNIICQEIQKFINQFAHDSEHTIVVNLRNILAEFQKNKRFIDIATALSGGSNQQGPWAVDLPHIATVLEREKLTLDTLYKSISEMFSTVSAGLEEISSLIPSMSNKDRAFTMVRKTVNEALVAKEVESTIVLATPVTQEMVGFSIQALIITAHQESQDQVECEQEIKKSRAVLDERTYLLGIKPEDRPDECEVKPLKLSGGKIYTKVKSFQWIKQTIQADDITDRDVNQNTMMMVDVHSLLSYANDQNLEKKSIQDIQEILATLKEEYNNSSTCGEGLDKNEYIITTKIKMLACLSELFFRSTKKVDTLGTMPNMAQFLVLLHNIRASGDGGTMSQVDTGEGKSLIIVISAVISAICGEKVVCVTHNKPLAVEAQQRYSIFMQNVNLTQSAITSPSDKNYDSNITYVPIDKLVADFTIDRGLPKEKQCLRRHLKKNSKMMVVVDECDFVLLDKDSSSNHRLSCSLPTEDEKKLLDIRIAVLKFLNSDLYKEGTYKSKEELLSMLRYWVYQYINDDDMKSIFNSVSNNEWLHDTISSFLSAYDLTEDQDFTVALFRKDSDGEVYKISPVAINSGRRGENSSFSHGVSTALAIILKNSKKHKGKKIIVPSNSLVTDVTNVGLTFKQMQDAGDVRFSLLSGTIGSDTEIEEMSKALNINNVCKVPRNDGKSKLSKEAIQSVEKDKIDTIVMIEIMKVIAIRPVLIIVNTIAEANALRTYVDNNKLLIGNSKIKQVLSITDTELSKGNFLSTELYNITEAAKIGSVTIATQAGARGTNITPESNALKNGGLHVVIIDDLTCGERANRQAEGRSARQGQPGSVARYVVREKLAKLQPRSKERAISSLLESLYKEREQLALIKRADEQKILSIVHSELEDCVFNLSSAMLSKGYCLGLINENVLDEFKDFLRNAQLPAADNPSYQIILRAKTSLSKFIEAIMSLDSASHSIQDEVKALREEFLQDLFTYFTEFNNIDHPNTQVLCITCESLGVEPILRKELNEFQKYIHSFNGQLIDDISKSNKNVGGIADRCNVLIIGGIRKAGRDFTSSMEKLNPNNDNTTRINELYSDWSDKIYKSFIQYCRAKDNELFPSVSSNFDSSSEDDIDQLQEYQLALFRSKPYLEGNNDTNTVCTRYALLQRKNILHKLNAPNLSESKKQSLLVSLYDGGISFCHVENEANLGADDVEIGNEEGSLKGSGSFSSLSSCSNDTSERGSRSRYGSLRSLGSETSFEGEEEQSLTNNPARFPPATLLSADEKDAGTPLHSSSGTTPEEDRDYPDQGSRSA